MNISDIQFEKYRSVSTDGLFKVRGKVVNVVGLTIESAGIRQTKQHILSIQTLRVLRK